MNEETQKVRITKEAFEKMNEYAKITSEIVDKDVECAGLLLNKYCKEDDLARDVYLCKGQTITSLDSKFDFHQETEDYKTILNNNMKISGIWHSHGAITAMHSNDDDRHLKKMYTTKARLNKITLERKKQKPNLEQNNGNVNLRLGNNNIICKKGMITIKTIEGNVAKINIEGKIKQIEEEKLREEGFVNSVVINRELYKEGIREKGKSYYCESLIGTSPIDVRKRKNLELEIVKEENNIEKRRIELVKEIGERVTYDGKLLKEHRNYPSIYTKYSNLDIMKVENYKQKLLEFCNNQNENTNQIARILLGEYEKEGKKVWKWDDRIKEIEKIQKNGNTHGKDMNELYTIISENKYLKRKRPKTLQRLEKTMKECDKSTEGKPWFYNSLTYLRITATNMIKTRDFRDYANKVRTTILGIANKQESLREIAMEYASKCQMKYQA